MKRALALGLLASLGSTAAAAQQAEIPLRNWVVPPYTAASGGGYTTMVDATPPRLFIGLEVCRLLDTRPPASNPLDGDGVYAVDQTRAYDLEGHCGIPTTTNAVSLNITVTNTGSHPFGHLKIWPFNQAEPNVSTLNWAIGGATVANAAIVALSPTGAISVKTGNAGADVIIDVNGYFASTPQTQGNYLQLINNSNSYTAYFSNDSTTCGGICGLFMGVAAGTAIQGETTGTTEQIYGVEGRVVNFTANSAGVFGTIGSDFGTNFCCGPAGVRGQSAHVGVVGLGKDIGVAGRIYDAGGNAVAAGDLAAPTGPNATFGVRGTSLTSGIGSAGVKGSDYSGEPTDVGTCCEIAGVRGVSRLNHGVQGVSRDVAAVVGFNLDGAGSILALGALGVNDALGVYYQNGLAGTGTKSFVEPHPRDASKAIRYVSLEGNEAGTYFRGRGKFERGLARITVPEDFRMVTDPDGLTVQITPIGEMASYAVVRVGLDEIVVKSSRNVDFFYAVNGQRRAYKDWQPIVASKDFFMPQSADEKLPASLGPEERKRLIDNGTYNADGTVNMETAERLGWTRVWKERLERQEAALARARAEVSRVSPAEPQE